MTVYSEFKAKDLIWTLKIFKDWSNYSWWVNLMS